MNALATTNDRTTTNDSRDAHDVDADRWHSVLTRDRAADGRFFYAVTSTGIFCRPSCPSRRPLRARVRYFESADEAERAGYRACLRCRPLEAATDLWAVKIQRACADIVRASTPPRLSVLAHRAGSSPYHFLRNFKRIVGVTPRAFAEARRLDTVKRALRTNSDITTAFLDAGYASSSRFYEGAASRLAMTPSAYRGGAAGQTIRYATVDSPVGRVLVAATPKGICRVALGDSDAALLAELRDEYPQAQLVASASDLRASMKQVIDHLSGRLPRLDLPLDVRATAFQWQVWDALRSIPRGETRTYGQVAEALGRPAAARAVARACASNPVALAVPCHRVVPAGGGVGGYRWGSERKEKLLAGERTTARGRVR
jgi:AraC family transcriptional regulator, regulatory protein of adaptative response / methylated-DNA-[protein]-cysteine methyltransferase